MNKAIIAIILGSILTVVGFGVAIYHTEFDRVLDCEPKWDYAIYSLAEVSVKFGYLCVEKGQSFRECQEDWDAIIAQVKSGAAYLERRDND